MKEFRAYYQIKQRNKLRYLTEVEFTNSKDATDCHLASVKYDYYIGKVENVLYYQFDTELRLNTFLDFIGKEYEKVKNRKVIKYEAESSLIQVKLNGKIVDYE